MQPSRSSCEIEAEKLLQGCNESASSSYQHGLSKRMILPNVGSSSIFTITRVKLATLFSTVVVLILLNKQIGTNNASVRIRKNLDKKYFLSLLKEGWTFNTSPILSELSPKSIGYPTFNRYVGKVGQVYGAYLSQGTVATGKSLPTNRWYQNLLLGNPEDEYGRVYTIPYIVDTAGSITGLRVHYPRIQASASIVQMVFDAEHGLTIGTDDENLSHQYVVDEFSGPSELGVTLKWREDSHTSKDGKFMISPLARGMPYATMLYSSGVTPVIQSTDLPSSPLLLDGFTRLKCDGSLKRVQNDVLIHFKGSDFTYLIFFSRPIDIQCSIFEGTSHAFTPGIVFQNNQSFTLRVADDTVDEIPVDIRVALASNCTTGSNPSYCEDEKPRKNVDFIKLLRNHSNIYSKNPYVKYAFPDKNGVESHVQNATLIFDWNAQNIKDRYSSQMSMHAKDSLLSLSSTHGAIRSNLPQAKPQVELLTYALPHHREIIEPLSDSSNTILGFCHPTLHGDACLVVGKTWVMNEDLGGVPNVAAPRPPKAFAIPSLSQAIKTDIMYTPDQNFMIGAGDTYFSGKQIARLARIIAITSELKGLKNYSPSDIKDHETDDKSLLDIIKACKEADLPSDQTLSHAVERLKQGTEVWLNGTAEAIFTYDGKYGGLVNCGCDFDEETRHCRNIFPNCPGYDNAGMNFGNGFYNDHHFHYGYHIYAAAIASSYDPEWGKKYFEYILLYIRDIANPSSSDEFFPTFRHKDWFLGSSWASGIATIGNRPYPNGRNQESSSEAIAAYEAIGLYGEIMVKVYGGDKALSSEYPNAITASRIRDLGRLLAATEIRSAKAYWHSMKSDSPGRLYPPAYTPPAVGMLWSTMAQFQTWFGNAPFLPIGIQLIPITPISERRDSLDWSMQLFKPFSESCNSDSMCEEQGWSILEYCLLAEVGHPTVALEGALTLPLNVFESAGGNGHSMTNTLWYISTRPTVDSPLDLSDVIQKKNIPTVPAPITPVTKLSVNDCGLPKTCTWEVLDANANGFSCKSRMNWLMNNMDKSESEACHQVSGMEYPTSCGGCDPTPGTSQSNHSNVTLPIIVENPNGDCPPCSSEICANKIMNRCPLDGTWYICTSGPATKGCATVPWRHVGIDSRDCLECCTLTPHCGDIH